ncbi:TPA: phage tail spike protein [Streptococcus suis]
MLYLLDKDIKTVKWNGIPLHEANSAIVKEEINGDFTLIVRYPITDTGIYQLIKEDMLIKAPVPVLGPQLFRIKKPVENDDSLDIAAYHITDDVMTRSIRPMNIVRQACGVALSQMVQNAKTELGIFSFSSDITDNHTFNTDEDQTLYSVLLDGKHSIVGTWEGELVRDNFALTVKRSRGADRGVIITTHRNLKSYQRTKNSQGVVTRIHARSTFRPEGAEKDTVISVTVDSPLINSYPYVNEKEYQNNDIKSIEELRKWAERKFKYEHVDKPSDEIKVEAYELDGQVIHLGDTVNIKSRKHDVDIYKKAIAYEYNALTEEYISITFDDKSSVGGSGISSGVANAADAILGVNLTAQEIALERAIQNANQAFDAEFEKRKKSIEDGIEQAQAEAERYADNIKQEITTEIAQVNASMQAQAEEHDRQVADILSKTQSIETLANQAKTDAASAIVRANQVKTEAIADARAQVATVSQALNTAKTDLQNQVNAVDAKAVKVQADATALRTDLNQQAQTILAQAQAQTVLTSRVTTVETLADGTKTTVSELSKTVNKATGDIASVTSRTKIVEDSLAGVKTNYTQLNQTVNAQTGQIDSINRKTADLQSGIDGVNNRFETIWVSEKNLLSNTETLSTYSPLAYPANNYLGRAIKRITKSANTSAYAEGLVMQTNETLVNPKEMILSFYVKANRDARIRCFMYNPNANKDVATSDGYTAKSSVDGMAVLNVTTSWQRVWIKWTYLVNYLAKPRIIIGRILETYDTDVSVDISAPALYHGHHNKEWSPADVDYKNELATYVQNAQESSAELSRRIETADGKAVEAKAYAQQTAAGFNTRIESLESYKNAEGTRAEQYLSASRTETAKQLSAERVAIANNYVAKSTYTEDARGTTLKLNEIKSTADTAKQNLATYKETVDRKLTELTSSTQTLDGKINTASAKVDTVAGQIRTEISTVEGKIPTTIGATNYIRDFGFANNPNFNSHTSLWKYERIADSTARSGYHIKATCTQSGSNGFHRYFYDLRWARYQGRVMTYSVDIKASKSVRMRLGAEAFNKGYKAFDVTTEWQRFVSTDTVNFKTYYSFPFYADTITWAVGDIIYIRDPQLEDGTIATTPRAAEEDLRTDISSIKTTITQTASGVEQLSTSLSTTNNKVSTAETKISQLISDVSSKVSQTDYNTLTGRVSSAETAITQNATEISKRLTSTQVEQAITDKGYATVTALNNKVKETADSFSRTISETKALIPNSMSNRNLALGTSDSWSAYVSTNNANVNWHVEICRVNLKYDRVFVGKKLNLFVHISADNVTLNSSSSHKIAIQAYVIKKDGSVLWHDDNPFHRQWVRDLNSGNNYHIVKLSKEVKTSIYEEGARLVVECRIDGANHVDFHHRGVMVTASDIFPDAWSPAPEDVATVTALHDVKDTVSSHTRTIGAVGETGSILDNVSKVTQTANGLVQEVSGTNGLKTQVSQLKNSWAVQLSGPEGLKTAINASTDGIRLKGKNLWLDGNTLIDNAVITSAMIADLDAGKITTGYLAAARIRAGAIDGSKIAFDEAFFNGLTANQAYLKKLFAKDAFITSVQAVSLSASQIVSGVLRAMDGAMDINLNDASMVFREDAKIEFQSENNTLYRTKNGTSAFIHFRDDTYNGVYTAMGVNADNTGTQNDYSSGAFAGVRVIRTNPNRYSGTTVDEVQLVGDTINMRHAFGSANDYLRIKWDGGSRIDLIQFLRAVSNRLGIALA